MSDPGKSTASRKVPAGVDKFSFGSKIIDETLTVDLKNSMIAYSPGAGHNVWHGGMARRHGTAAWPLAVNAAAVMNRHLATFRSNHYGCHSANSFEPAVPRRWLRLQTSAVCAAAIVVEPSDRVSLQALAGWR